MRRASFARARCEPHAFSRPVYAARFRASDIVALCAFPTPKRNGKTPAAPECDRWRFFEITFASHDFAVLQLAASLKLLARDGWYAGGSPVLAVLARADGNGDPACPLPLPAFEGGGGITVTDSRGFPPHSSNPSEALSARAPDGAVCYSVVSF